MIIQPVFGGSSAVITKIKIKPFARCLLGNGGSSWGWTSNDPAVISQHGAITLTAASRCIQQFAYYGYQILSYYELVAVMSDGTELNLKHFNDAGISVQANVTDTISGYGVYNCSIFDEGAHPVGSSTKTSTVTCPANLPKTNVIGYNNGATVSFDGCFIYMSAKASNSGYNIYNTCTINSISVGGVSYPVELSTDWGDR